jgi:hypothetical protein
VPVTADTMPRSPTLSREKPSFRKAPANNSTSDRLLSMKLWIFKENRSSREALVRSKVSRRILVRMIMSGK